MKKKIFLMLIICAFLCVTGSTYAAETAKGETKYVPIKCTDEDFETGANGCKNVYFDRNTTYMTACTDKKYSTKEDGCQNYYQITVRLKCSDEDYENERIGCIPEKVIKTCTDTDYKTGAHGCNNKYTDRMTVTEKMCSDEMLKLNSYGCKGSYEQMVTRQCTDADYKSGAHGCQNMYIDTVALDIWEYKIKPCPDYDVYSKFGCKNKYILDWSGVNDVQKPPVISGTVMPGVANLMPNIWATVSFLIQIASVMCVVFAGVRYMFASADQKADIKQGLAHLTIGACLVFGATTIIKIVVKVLGEVVR